MTDEDFSLAESAEVATSLPIRSVDPIFLFSAAEKSVDIPIQSRSTRNFHGNFADFASHITSNGDAMIVAETPGKAASGTLEKMPLIRVTNLVRTLETLKKGGFWVAGLAADGRTTIGGAKLSGKIALCLGSEGDGLRRLTREACDLLLRLPMVPGAVESLNVSNAAAVALYAARQEALEEFSTPTS
jgi:tRNA(Leu) C34 or U34 (ribose-2'-O)-methylase TrmL